MCGINGFTWQDADVLHRMHEATHHRGPDDEGFYLADGISLAHNRLSIIDLSPGGREPMSTADGRYTIVFNGEIYNYLEIKRDLEARGRKFFSRTDTEVLLQAFAEWNADCLPRLNGIFAFTVWDRDKRELTLARDPVGIKPLYYFWKDGRLVFSSEIKALLASGIKKELNIEALNLYFRFLYVPGPQTIFQGISKLPAGSVMRVRDGQFDIRHYHEIKEGPYLTDRKAATEELRRLVKEAVKRQLVSDRPLGVFLSGGIDSTSVLAMMREISGSDKIKTFSVAYAKTEQAEKYNSDAELARRTADFFGTEHHELVLDGSDVARSFEDVVWHMDEPVSNHIQPSTFLLAKFSKPQITVALGGDGGDELFGGYDRYWLSSFVDRVRAMPALFRHRFVLRLAEKLTGKKGLTEKAGVPPGVERFLSFIGQKQDQALRFIRPAYRREEAGLSVFQPYFSKPWQDFTNQFMATDARTWLPDESLIRTDKLTMAHALEERVPLLDLELFDFAYRLPSSWKLKSKSQGKRILVDVMRPYLPPHIFGVKKQGFFSPAAKWLRGDLKIFAEQTLSDDFAPGSGDYLDLTEARQALHDHITKRRYGLNQVWSVMTFQTWYKKFML